MSISVKHSALLVLVTAILSGCNNQAAPVAPAPNAANANTAAALPADTPPAPVNVPPATNEPGPSGKDFTIWNARKVGHSIELQYRRDAAGGHNDNYRLLLQTPDGETIYADLGRSMPGRSAGVGVASTIKMSLAFTGLSGGGKDATLRIVKYSGFGLNPEEGQTDASNTIPLETPAGLAGSGTGGGAGGEVKPPKIDPETTPPDSIAWKAHDAWRSLQQEYGKAKIAVLRLEGGETVDFVEGVHEKVAAYKKKHPDAKVYELLDDKEKPAILVAPAEDLVATAKEFDLGSVSRTDSFEGVAFVTLDTSKFELNSAGIMEDESHPEYFETNLALWQAKALNDQFGQLAREAGPSIKRLAKADPDQCPEEFRAKIGKQFKSLFNSEKRFFDDDLRIASIEGYALWDPKNAGPDFVSSLRELAREHFFAKEEEGECLMEQLGKLKETSAVDPLAIIIAGTAEFGRPNQKLLEPAADALIAIGEESEDAALKLVKNNDQEVCLTGIRILGEVGTKKSLSLLGEAATESRNLDVRDAAKGAMRTIRARSAGK